MATEKGLSAAIEFTKHLMTIAGGGIGFIAALNTSGLGCFQKVALISALSFLALSISAGLFVWSRATMMMSSKQYALTDPYLRIPGLVNIFSFFLGVTGLGVFVLFKVLP